MRRYLSVIATIIIGLSAPAFAQEASSAMPIDSLMPRSEAEAAIAGFETRITALEARKAQFLNDVTLAQTAVVAIALGPRKLTVSTNCQVGDRMFMSPSASIPAGYQLGDIYCVSNGTAEATLYAPLLGIGASYSIIVRVTAFR